MTSTEDIDVRLRRVEATVGKLLSAQRAHDSCRADDATRANLLVQLYLDVRLGKHVVTRDTQTLWNLVMTELTTSDVLRLIRKTQDPFAWRVLLRYTIELVQGGLYVVPAFVRLHTVARAVLDEQGLRTVPIKRLL